MYLIIDSELSTSAKLKHLKVVFESLSVIFEELWEMEDMARMLNMKYCF